jgi:hypothetical protein
MASSEREVDDDLGRKAKAAAPPDPVERRMSKFLREPPSVRTAASVIVITTAFVVAAGGLGMRLLDHSEYPSIWAGMWWAIPDRHDGRLRRRDPEEPVR